MATYAKAFGATALAAAPVLMKQFIDPPWDWVAIAGYVVVIFVGYLRVFQPDERFRLIRDPTLDAAFAQTFAEDFELESASDVETPFRVHVFTCRMGMVWGRKFGLSCKVPRRKLCVTYAYNSHPSHPDHGRSWPRGHGAVWQAYQTGEAQFTMQQDEKWKTCGLDAEEEQATSHVYAVFAIPLRRPANSDAEVVSSRVTAVLSIDALTPEAAEVLKQQYELFKASKARKLLDRAALVSLYF